MYFLFQHAPVIVVELGVLGTHVGHVKALRHRRFVPAHIHGGGHVAAAVSAAAVFPVFGTVLDVVVFGVVVVLAYLMVRGVGHRYHGRREFVGHAVGNPVRRVVVHPDGFVVQHLVGHPFWDAHAQQCVGALLRYGRCCRLADGGHTYQRRSYRGFVGFLCLAGLAGLFLVLLVLFIFLGLFLALGLGTPLSGNLVVARQLRRQGTAHHQSHYHYPDFQYLLHVSNFLVLCF